MVLAGAGAAPAGAANTGPAKTARAKAADRDFFMACLTVRWLDGAAGGERCAHLSSTTRANLRWRPGVRKATGH